MDTEGASGSMMDEDEERRMRMERMVEDTERMELMAPEGGGGNNAEEEQQQQQKPRSRQRQLEPDEQRPAKARSRSPAVNRSLCCPGGWGSGRLFLNAKGTWKLGASKCFDRWV